MVSSGGGSQKEEVRQDMEAWQYRKTGVNDNGRHGMVGELVLSETKHSSSKRTHEAEGRRVGCGSWTAVLACLCISYRRRDERKSSICVFTENPGPTNHHSSYV